MSTVTGPAFLKPCFESKIFSGLLFIACIRLVLPFVAEQVKAFKLGESFLSANSVAKFASQGQMG